MKPGPIMVRIPGSTSNLGPGFDTLGLAFDIYNCVRVTRRAQPGVRFQLPVEPQHLPGAITMASDAVNAFFAASGLVPFGIDVGIESDVPVARGLGFSATVRLGIFAGLNELAETGWDRQKLLEAVTNLEGHPDNASPAVWGGFTVSSRLETGVRCLHFPVPERARFVTLIPPFGIPTKEARRLVPNSFSRADAVHNLNRSALIAAAFASGNLESLRGCFEDRVHQPYREKLIPQLSSVIRGRGERGGDWWMAERFGVGHRLHDSWP